MNKKQTVKKKKPRSKEARLRTELVIDRFIRGEPIRGREDRRVLATWLAPSLAELDAMAARVEAGEARENV